MVSVGRDPILRLVEGKIAMVESFVALVSLGMGEGIGVEIECFEGLCGKLVMWWKVVGFLL